MLWQLCEEWVGETTRDMKEADKIYTSWQSTHEYERQGFLHLCVCFSELISRPCPLLVPAKWDALFYAPQALSFLLVLGDFQVLAGLIKPLLHHKLHRDPNLLQFSELQVPRSKMTAPTSGWYLSHSSCLCFEQSGLRMTQMLPLCEACADTLADLAVATVVACGMCLDI